MNTFLKSEQVSLLHVSGLRIIPSPTTQAAPRSLSHATPQRRGRWLSPIQASPFPSRLAALPRPNRVHSRYGLIVLLQLLSTPCHQDAVTVRYRPESVCLKRTRTSQTKHTHRRTGNSSRCRKNWRLDRQHGDPVFHILVTVQKSFQSGLLVPADRKSVV